jgi:signal transduction histidine kinase
MKGLKTIFWLIFFTGIHFFSTGQQFIYQPITIQHGLPSNYVTSMYFDRNGIFWIGTDKGICRFNGKATKSLTIDEGLSGNLVHFIFQDKKGSIWAACHEGGLSEIISIEGEPIVKSTIKPGFSIRKIICDVDGTYWIKGWRKHAKRISLWRTKDISDEWDHVVEFNKENELDVDIGGYIRYIEKNNLYWNKSLLNKIKKVSLVDWVKQIISSNNRILYAGTRKFEIEEFSSSGFKSYLKGTFESEPIGIIKYLAAGSHDLIYKTGTKNIIYKNKSLLDNKYSNEDIQSYGIFYVVSDNYQNLYYSIFGNGIIAANKGYIRKFDMPQATTRLKTYGSYILATTEKHLFIFDSAFSKPVKNPYREHGAVNFTITNKTEGIIEANGHSLYYKDGRHIKGWTEIFSDFSDGLYFNQELFLTSYSHGISKVRDGILDTAWQKRLKLPGYCLERLAQFDGKIFATTLSKGLLEINPVDGSLIHYDKSKGLISNTVYSVFKLKDTIYVGTRLGLNYITNDTIVQVGASKGFVGEEVLCVFKDYNHTIWVLSDKFLHIFFNDRLYAIRSHPVLLSENQFIKSAVFNEATNNLWIGTDKYVFALDVSRIEPDNMSYPIGLASVSEGPKVFNLKSNTFSLPYNHEPLRISISNPFYSLFQKPEIYFRLVGFDNNFNLLDGGNTIVYQKLPPGKYRFEAKSIGPDFGSVPPKSFFEIEVLNPWWKRGLFLWSLFMILSLVVFFVSRYFLRIGYMQRLKVMEAEQALQVERLRIGRELHDNIGSMLTLMINKVDDMPDEHAIKDSGVSTIARQTLAQLRDAIWALNKEDLSTQQWASHATEYIHTISGKGITADSIFNWNPEIRLSPLEALHSFRILQEAITNAIKHANATNVYIRGEMAGEKLVLVIRDNGKGFNEKHVRKGYGLRNIQRRAQEMDAVLKIENSEGKGTEISLAW